MRSNYKISEFTLSRGCIIVISFSESGKRRSFKAD